MTVTNTWSTEHYRFTTFTLDCGCTFTSASNNEDLLDITVVPDTMRMCETGRALYAAKQKADIDWDHHSVRLK